MSKVTYIHQKKNDKRDVETFKTNFLWRDFNSRGQPGLKESQFVSHKPKETYERNLRMRPTKETNKRDPTRDSTDMK